MQPLLNQKVIEILEKIRRMDNPQVTFATILQFIKILSELIKIYEEQVAKGAREWSQKNSMRG